MSDNLTGDVKRLTDSTPEYRLRAGDYWILFEVEKDSIDEVKKRMAGRTNRSTGSAKKRASW
jgi:hypothetical protein